MTLNINCRSKNKKNKKELKNHSSKSAFVHMCVCVAIDRLIHVCVCLREAEFFSHEKSPFHLHNYCHLLFSLPFSTQFYILLFYSILFCCCCYCFCMQKFIAPTQTHKQVTHLCNSQKWVRESAIEWVIERERESLIFCYDFWKSGNLGRQCVEVWWS